MLLSPAESGAVPAAPDPAPGLDTAPPALAPTILLVDDERDVLAALEIALIAHGYLVASAANGADAIEKALALHPAAVITDLLMPVVDGIALAKALRANPVTAATKIVMCSGVSEDSVRPLFGGYDAFLQKPYDLEELRETLATLLAND